MNRPLLCFCLTFLLSVQDVRAKSKNVSASDSEQATKDQQVNISTKRIGLHAPDQYRIYEILPGEDYLPQPVDAPFSDGSPTQPPRRKHLSRDRDSRYPKRGRR